MSEWYYADRSGQQQGPVRSEDLSALRAAGQIGWDTLVWRNGMGDWQPMSAFRSEFEPVGAMPSAAPLPQDAVSAPAAATASAASVAANGYSMYEVAKPLQADPREASHPADPYAAPRANLATAHVVNGGPVVYAGFWRRVAAYLVDGFLMGIVTWAIQIPIILSMGIGANALGNSNALGAMGIGMIMMLYLVPLLLQMGYYGWFHSSVNQATLGKRAVGIKVSDMQGGRISMGRAIGRYWAFALSGLTMGIGYIMAAFTQQKQALHDMICSTLVVDQHAYTDHPEWQQEGLDTVTKVILGIGLVLFVLFGLAMCAVIAGGIAAAKH